MRLDPVSHKHDSQTTASFDSRFTLSVGAFTVSLSISLIMI
jgi:hypothetical protein